MLLKVIEYFIPVKAIRKDPEYQRRTKLVVYTIFITAIFALLYVGVSLIAGFFMGILIMLGCFLGDIVLLFLLKKGLNVIKAANLFGLIGTASIFGCTFFSGGLYSPVFPWLAETPIIILLIAGRKSGIFWVMVSVLLILTIGYLHFTGLVVNPQYAPQSTLFFYLTCTSGLVLIIFITAFIFEKVRINAFNDILKQKDELYYTLLDLKAKEARLIHSEKMASLGELTAGIAHEIQNPLNFINNFSEVNVELLDELKETSFDLTTNEEKEQAQELLGDITQNQQKINYHGKRADSIIKNMLLHARTNSGQKEVILINDLVKEYIGLSYHGFRAKEHAFQVHITTDFDAEAGKIAVIPQEFGRVLLNLLNNAFYAVLQHSRLTLAGEDTVPYQPQVRVSTKNLAHQLEIRITDNGPGIPQSVKKKIFQPFFTTKPTGEGTGLGLSLSYEIITKGHGGELLVQSEEGAGATFIILMPLPTRS